ncbi:MAG: hypothetical protein EOM68_23780 [Spirochaetia bacterium]|nr:hypothetical protein [Spirochaetia bacterium]
MQRIIRIVISCVIGYGAFAEESAAMPMNTPSLRASDKNVRREAMDALYREYGKDYSDLSAEHLDKQDLEYFLQRWEENSYMAALLLGQFGQTDSIPVLERVREEARAINDKADEMDDRRAIASRMEYACLKALLRLGDRNAAVQVKQMLVAGDSEGRVRGLECISYARQTDLIPDVLPLLDDGRDALNIAPSGGTFYLRVCDIAANTINEVIKVDLPFPVEQGQRYTQDQLSQLREAAKGISLSIPKTAP